MTLQLTYRGETTVPVEVEGLTPDWAADKTVAAIERFEILHGNHRVPLAEMFKVSGDAGDRNLVIEGNLAGVHWIGAQMSSGKIHVRGAAGRHVGSRMKGGSIVVEGDAGDWLGAEMRGGLIHGKGNAGHLVGAAYRGSARGMTGGTILIDGDVGNEPGHSMRRGLIAVGRAAGDMLGFNMIAGTIFVFGECGIRPGAGMRRGTIGLLGPKPPKLLPSFRYACTSQLPFMRLLLHRLSTQGFPVDPALMAAEFDLHHGDMISLGRGEILFRHVAA